MRIATVILLVIAIGLSGSVAYLLSELERKTVRTNQLETQNVSLQAELYSFPEVRDGQRLVAIPDRVIEIDCPRYLAEKQGAGSHCAFLHESVPNLIEWTGIVSVSGTYETYKREDIWAMEAGAPAGTMATCHVLKVQESSPNFTDSVLESTLGGNSVSRVDKDRNLLLNLPFEELSDEERHLIMNGEDSVKITAFLKSSLGSVVPVCYSKLFNIIEIEAS